MLALNDQIVILGNIKTSESIIDQILENDSLQEFLMSAVKIINIATSPGISKAQLVKMSQLVASTVKILYTRLSLVCKSTHLSLDKKKVLFKILMDSVFKMIKSELK